MFNFILTIWLSQAYEVSQAELMMGNDVVRVILGY